MNHYSQTEISNIQNRHFAFIKTKIEDHVLYVTLNRENKKNALHPHMVNELYYVFQYANQTKSIWAIVLDAVGNVFCAGADLKAMAGIIEPHDSTIPKPQKEIILQDLFNELVKPLICKVDGDVFAGGFMILANATFVLARDNVKLSLPEVKRGLFPFQVMSSMMEVMPKRKVLDWCIRGLTYTAKEAVSFGLISTAHPKAGLDDAVDNLVNEIKRNSPTAIRLGIEAYKHIQSNRKEHHYLSEMLKKAIQSPDGQEGLKAFREKRDPQWIG